MQQRRAGAALCGVAPAVWLLSGVVLVTVAGCAAFGQRGPKAQKMAACRELSRQGVSAMEMGHWQEAERLLQKAIEAWPDDADARRAMAETLWRRGAVREAMSHMEVAIGSRPNDATLSVRAGEMALAIGERDIALSHAEQAIRLNPQLGTAWALRGRVFWQIGEADRALADLGRALEFAPDSTDVLLDLAVMYRDRGKPGRCLTTLYHLEEIYTPDAEPQSVLVLQGLALLDLGRPHQACDSFLAAARRGPASAQVMYYLAQAQYSSGRPAEAMAAAQQALAMDASHEASRQLLAQLAAHIPAAERQRR